MFAYVTNALGLSEATASNVLNVSRVCRDHAPQLKEKIRTGEIGLSKARKLCPVLKIASEKKKSSVTGTKKTDSAHERTKDEWIQLAENSNTREIEREVSKVSPAPRRKDTIRAVGPDRFRVSFEITEEELKMLKRVMALESTRKKENIQPGEAITASLGLYIEKLDPLKKAERSQKRSQKFETEKDIEKQTDKKNSLQNRGENLSVTKISKRTPIPAKVAHAVRLRDHGKCRFCGSDRYLELHHIVPVSQGGENTVENLITVCSAHHKFIHENPQLTRDWFKRKNL
jgi:5-methylcytosine-specific restriction endonuclease McrA